MKIGNNLQAAEEECSFFHTRPLCPWLGDNSKLFRDGGALDGCSRHPSSRAHNFPRVSIFPEIDMDRCTRLWGSKTLSQTISRTGQDSGLALALPHIPLLNHAEVGVLRNFPCYRNQQTLVSQAFSTG